MTNEEKDRLIAYLVDAGEIDPEGDVEAQFLEWRQVHEQVVSGEVHYKAILEAAALVSEDMSTLIPDSTACCTWSPNQVVFPHPGGPTTRYSAASASVFFTDGIVFSLLHAGFFMPAFRRKSFRSFIYVETDSTYPFFIFRISTFAFRLLLIESSLSSI